MPVVGPHRVLHGVSQAHLLDKVVVPVVCTTNALIQIVAPCRKLWNIRSCSFPSRSSSRRCAETGSHGLTVLQTMEILLLQYIRQGVRRPGVQVHSFHGCSRGENSRAPLVFDADVEKTVEIPQLQRRCWTPLLTCLSLRNGRCRGWSLQCSKLWRLRSWHLSTGLVFFKAVYTGTRPG